MNNQVLEKATENFDKFWVEFGPSILLRLRQSGPIMLEKAKIKNIDEVIEEWNCFIKQIMFSTYKNAFAKGIEELARNMLNENI